VIFIISFPVPLHYGVKLKFHESGFLVASSWHTRWRARPDTRGCHDDVTTMLRSRKLLPRNSSFTPPQVAFVAPLEHHQHLRLVSSAADRVSDNQITAAELSTGYNVWPFPVTCARYHYHRCRHDTEPKYSPSAAQLSAMIHAVITVAVHIPHEQVAASLQNAWQSPACSLPGITINSSMPG